VKYQAGQICFSVEPIAKVMFEMEEDGQGKEDYVNVRSVGFHCLPDDSSVAQRLERESQVRILQEIAIKPTTDYFVVTEHRSCRRQSSAEGRGIQSQSKGLFQELARYENRISEISRQHQNDPFPGPFLRTAISIDRVNENLLERAGSSGSTCLENMANTASVIGKLLDHANDVIDASQPEAEYQEAVRGLGRALIAVLDAGKVTRSSSCLGKYDGAIVKLTKNVAAVNSVMASSDNGEACLVVRRGLANVLTTILASVNDNVPDYPRCT
jgi:hypothetical protein